MAPAGQADRRRFLYPVAAAIILAYFFFFTWKSLFLYFDQDDMENLYFAWSKPLGEVARAHFLFWNGFIRPLGAAFYRTLFAIAGFHPLPFHVAALALGVVNIGLCFLWARMVAGSERIAGLTALLFAFHTRLMEVWFRTAVIYDVLCFSFLYLAAYLYMSVRQRQGVLSWRRVAAIVLCFVAALDAKEMAVCLPVLLLFYELIFHKWRARLRLIGVLAVMALIYTIDKLQGTGSLMKNPAYTPEYAYARFSETWGAYLGHLFALKMDMPAGVAMMILAALLGIAIVARSRILIFAWAVIFFGMLPVSFSPARGAFVLYISYPGWCLYGAALLVSVQDWITKWSPRYRTAVASVFFLLAGWRMGKFNLHDQRADPRHWLYDPPDLVKTTAQQFAEMHPHFPERARILFVKEPFPDAYTTLFYPAASLSQSDAYRR